MQTDDDVVPSERTTSFFASALVRVRTKYRIHAQ